MTPNASRVNKHLRLLLLLPLLLYLAIPTANYYWDGVAYAIDIEKRQPAAALLHPSHLLYAWCGSILYKLILAIGLYPRALFVLQATNGLLAGLSVFLLYACMRRSGLPQSTSIPAALLFAFSATWWRFAGDANPYIPSIFFLHLSYFLLLERPRPLAAALAAACAMLQHQLAILFLPAALLELRNDRRNQRLFLLTALLPVAILYPLAYASSQSNPTIPGFLAWVTRHSPDSGFSFNLADSFFLSMRGTLRLFFGGKLSDFTGDTLSISCLAAFAIAVVYLLLVLKGKNYLRLETRPLESGPLLWLFACLAFLMFWMPQNTFYRLFYLAPLVTIAVWRAQPRLLFAGVPILFLWNFAFVIHPQSQTEFNVPLRFAVSQRDHWPAATPIVFHRFHPDLWTISYFNSQASWIGLETPDLTLLDQRLATAQILWLEQSAYDLLSAGTKGRLWLAQHEQPSQLIQFHDPKHDFLFHCVK